MNRAVYLKQWEIPGLLDGSKTLIVRPITPQPPEGYICAGRLLDTTGHHDRKNIGKVAFTDLDYKGAHYYKLPFEVGDVLLGRETWYHGDAWFDDVPDMAWKNVHIDGKCTWVDYKATFKDDGYRDWSWKSPAQMPEWAARIKLAVSEVRVLRVQELTEEECVAIGIKNPANDGYNWGRFASQWDVDYLKGPKYEINPWIAAAKIERVV